MKRVLSFLLGFLPMPCQPGRLVEGVAGLEDLGLVVVDGSLVLALQDVPERRAGMTVPWSASLFAA